MNKILVIIVSYNSMQWAKKCYDSLRSSTVACDIITIDNGSTDGTPDFIEKNYPEVTLVRNNENLGFGKANNIGLQKVLDENYEYAYLLNQDAWIMPDTLSNLINASMSHPEYGILSPMQMKADMQNLDPNFASYVLGEHQKEYPLLIEDLYFGRCKDVYSVTFVMAAHWFLTRNCIEQVGGFSPTFPQYGEDDNFIDRARYWGYRVGIVPSSKAVHDRADASWSSDKKFYVQNYVVALRNASNPLGKKSLNSDVKKMLKMGICWRHKGVLNYAFSLYKNKAVIDENFKRSLSVRAFLK